MDKANAQNGRQAKYPLLTKEQGDQGSLSSDTTGGESRNIYKVNVDIESNKKEETSVPLMMDSNVWPSPHMHRKMNMKNYMYKDMPIEKNELFKRKGDFYYWYLVRKNES